MNKKDLYQEVLKLQKQTNRRLLNIEKFTGNSERASWAGALLERKLDTKLLNAMTDKHRVKINPEMNETQLKIIQAEMEKFLNRSTSTIRGIKKQSIKQKKGMFNFLNQQNDVFGINEEYIESDIFTLEDAEKMFLIFEDEDLKTVVDQMGASEFIVFLRDSLTTKNGKIDFRKKFIEHMDIENDVENRKLASKIYDKFIK